jgi:hypothetical protein
LPRRPDQQLTCLPRLNIESHGIRFHRVSALQISELDQLVTDKIRVAIGDEQMSLSLSNREPWQQAGVRTDSGDDTSAAECCSIRRRHYSFAHAHDRVTSQECGAVLFCLAKKEIGRGRRVHNSIFGNQQSAREPGSLKNITAPAEDGLSGSHSNAPTTTSHSRGSRTTPARNASY